MRSAAAKQNHSAGQQDGQLRRGVDVPFDCDRCLTAAESLGAIEPKQESAVAALTKALKDADEDVRAEAAEALAAYPANGPAAVSRLLQTWVDVPDKRYSIGDKISEEKSNLDRLLEIARDDARLVVERDAELSGPRGAWLRTLLYLFERDAAVKYLRSG